MKKIILALAIMALVFTVGCSETKETEPVTGEVVAEITVEETTLVGSAEVIINGQSIEPSELKISRGTEVTWKKNDDKRHRIMENLGEFDSSEQLYDGKTYSHTFTKSMTYEYADVLSGGVGQIIVE